MSSLNRTLSAIAISAGLALFSAPSMALNIGFTESMDNSLTHTTDDLHSPDLGIVYGEIFTVTKNIHNLSDYSWTDFHITLESNIGGVWGPSPETDGISFAQVESVDDWLSHLLVSVNSVAMTGFTAYRDLAFPLDTMDIFFNNFTVNPDDTLTIRFDMSDNGPNDWRMSQHATVPEPGTFALVGLAGLGLLGLKRRRNGRELPAN